GARPARRPRAAHAARRRELRFSLALHDTAGGVFRHLRPGGEVTKRRGVTTVLAARFFLLARCGVQTRPSSAQPVKASWAEVLNQFQRRADLVPNLVNTVKGFAAQEKDVLLGVTNARAKVGGIQATPELINDPQAFAKFQAAQGEMTSALSRLLVVA